jgi:hypothetical protein
MTIIGFVVALVIVLLLIWAIQQLTAAFNTPPQIRTVILVLIVVAFVLWVLGMLGGLNYGPVLRFR